MARVTPGGSGCWSATYHHMPGT
ncbi:hypothetical protein E2C01_063563 [Portunus trituberculatus]|uniref:Uncharacterized protein n=1 Tax=Portunus trituberculatus TaxID=210409 RepID=A0A5B7HAS2_PORTR|nr:hypothetical protein [Portunus trituberculatus]